MHRHQFRSPPECEIGRAPLVVALSVAIAACVLAAYFFSRPDPGSAPHEPEVAGPGAPADGRAAEEAESAPGDGGLAEPAGAPPGNVAAENATALAPDELQATRVFGTITSLDGEPLSGLFVRWVPASRADLGWFRHDETVLGRDGDVTRVPPGRLREALSRSLAAESGEDGGYEIRAPGQVEGTFLIVSGMGYATAFAAVEPEKESVEEGPAEVPAAAGSTPRELRVDVAVGPGGTLAGTVRERATGGPAVGVAVTAAAVDPETPAIFSVSLSNEAPSAVSGADGGYRISGLAPATYRVATQPGESDFLPAGSGKAKTVALEEGVDVEGVDFEVTRGGSIRGKLAAADGSPVAGAKCSALSREDLDAAVKGDFERMLGRETASREDGGFAIRGLPLGASYFVFAEHDGFARARKSGIELTESRPVAAVELTLSPGVSVSGFVRYRDGSAAPDTTVRAMLESEDESDSFPGFGGLGGLARRSESDETGAFRLEHLAPGTYRIATGGMEEAFFKGRVFEKVVIDGSEDVAGLVLFLDRPERARTGGIGGVVLDDAGRPLDGVTVRVRSPQDIFNPTKAEATSGADGRFTVESLEGSLFDVNAEKPGHSSVELHGIVPGRYDLRLVLERFATVSGRVLTPAGAPGSGGTVRGEPVDQEDPTGGFARMMRRMAGGDEEAAVASDGSFSVEVPPGRIELVAVVPGHAPGRSEPLVVVAGQAYEGVEILVTPGATLHGRVTLGGPQGVEGATVVATPLEEGEATASATFLPDFIAAPRNRVTTDAKGYYALPHLAPGRYLVRATHESYAGSDPEVLDIVRDETRKVRDLILSIGARLSGRVLEGSEGKSGIMVQLLGEGGMKQGLTSIDGTFEFSGLRAGEYVVNAIDLATVAQQGGTPLPHMKTRNVTVEREGDQSLEIVFGSGFKVAGKIEGLDPGGTTIVTLRRPGGPPPEEVDPNDSAQSTESMKFHSGMAFVKDDGAFEVRDVEPGKYMLEVHALPGGLAAFGGSIPKEQRVPRLRREVTVRDGDLQLELRVAGTESR